MRNKSIRPHLAVLLAAFTVASSERAWSDLGETTQEVRARYQQRGSSVRPDTPPLFADNRMEFRHHHRVVLVWLQDGRSIAEMTLCPHGLRQDKIESFLTRQASSSTWEPVPCKDQSARVWARKDRRAIAWVTDPNSEFAVFAILDPKQIRHLARNESFKAVAAASPLLWAKVLEVGGMPAGLKRGALTAVK